VTDHEATHHRDASEARLLRRLVGGDPSAVDRVLALAPGSESASLLVAAALLSGDATYVARATALAGTVRERQLVSLADAHLRGDTELLDVLVRDHLADHPDHLLAAWIAARTKE
jgi:hypothetical protein